MNRPLPLKSLGLVGDGDEEDLVELLEKTFDIKFPGDELHDCATVGDLYTLLLKLCPPSQEQGKCANAMAFYRLRKALAGEFPGTKLVPATRLADLVAGSPRAFLDRLAPSSSLNLPAPPRDWACKTGWALIIASLAGALVGAFFGLSLAMLLFLIPGSLLVFSNRGDFGAMTLGDLACATAERNVMPLMREGADKREATLRRAAIRVMCEPTGVSPDRIGPQTRLIG